MCDRFFLTMQQERNSFYDSFVDDNYSPVGFFVKRRPFTSCALSKILCTSPHDLQTQEADGQTADVKVSPGLRHPSVDIYV